MSFSVFFFVFLSIAAFCGVNVLLLNMGGALLEIRGAWEKNIFFLMGFCAFLLWVFLFSPFLRGVYSLLFHKLLFDRTDHTLVFYYFSHPKRYKYSVLKTVFHLFRIFFCLFLFYGIATMGSVTAAFLSETGRSALSVLIVCISVIFLFLLLICFFIWGTDSFLMDIAQISAPLLNFRQLRALSAAQIRHKRKSLFFLILAFLPLLIFSVLLCGVPLLFVIPYYLGTRAVLAFRIIFD